MSASTLDEAIKRLWAQRPRFTQLLFLNCEFKETEGGMAMSDDTFSVVALPLGRPKRRTQDIDADTFALLVKAARAEAEVRRRSELILDVIARSSTQYKRVWSDEPLLRLTGVDRAFRQRHQRYAKEEPLLARLGDA